jgi:hypothetical protein
MDHKDRPWKMVFSDFSKNHLFTKSLGPSLGANQMWTMRNDDAPKNEFADVFKYMPKK